MWFAWREHIGRIGFYVLFAFVVTSSVQLVGVYLVFTTLIVPAVATYRHAPSRQLVYRLPARHRQLRRRTRRVAGDGPAVESRHRVGHGRVWDSPSI